MYSRRPLLPLPDERAGVVISPLDAESFKNVLNLIKSTGQPIQAIPLLVKKTWKTEKPVTYKEQWEALQKQADVPRVAVQIESEADLKGVEELFGRMKAEG